MANWKYSFDLNAIISEYNQEYSLDDNDSLPPNFIQEIVSELESKPAIVSMLMPYIRRFRRCKTVKSFNVVLKDLYDFSDVNEIWLGL